MKRPIVSEWTIQEGEETEEMPTGSFLPNAFREAQEKYINFLEEKISEARQSENSEEISRILDF